MHHHLIVCAFALSAACVPAAPATLTSATVSRHEAPLEHRLDLYQRAHALERDGRCDDARASYREYASAVRPFDPESARLATRYADLCWTPAKIDTALSDAITAVLTHDPTRALALLDSDQSRGPWRDYVRGVALADLHRTDDAAAAFDVAERAFPASDITDRSMALYGKARAYHDALRCADAWVVYDAFADLVRAAQPAEADMALAYARDCVKR